MCNRIRLAGNGIFNIDVCACGKVHVTVGFATLRFEPSAYKELVSLLDEGVRAMEAQTLDNATVH